MSKKTKVWVIDPEKLRSRKNRTGAVNGSEKIVSPEVTGPSQQPGSTMDLRPDPRPGPVQESRPDPRQSSQSHTERKQKKSSPPHILLTYLLGPFGLLIMRDGRQSRFWVSVSAASGVLSLAILWKWSAVLSRFEGGAFMIPLCIFIMFVLTVACITSWARAALLIGRRRGSVRRDLPDWMKRPWSAGSLGLLVPGLGLVVAGYPRRAAFALLTVGTMLPSALILSQSDRLWRWNQGSGSVVISGSALEYIFLIMGLLVFLGVMAWIVQALDGVRLAGSRSARQGGPRSEWLSIALLASMVVFLVMFKPAFVARNLDHYSVSMHQEGYRIIPLYLSLGAVHLDPSQPGYVMHASDIYEDLGKHREARIMRQELYEKWIPCMQAWRRHGLLDYGLASLQSQGSAPVLSGAAAVIEEQESGTWELINALYGPPEPPGDDEIMFPGR